MPLLFGTWNRVTVTAEQLVRWAAAATLADSYMSLVYHRGAIKEWDTPAAPRRDEWERAMHKARRTSEELCKLLDALGVGGSALSREMDRELFMPQESLARVAESEDATHSK